MKKGLLIFMCLICLGGIAIYGGIFNRPKTAEGYLRVHIRANSNSDEDQAIKYAIKESVTDYLTPKILNSKTATEAMKIVNSELDELSSIATQILKTTGFKYKAKARLCEEFFPTRSYNEVVLENGYYDALIIDLGEAAGDNWWCVVYPPLCFLGGDADGNVVYKSFLEKLFRK